MIVPFRRFLLAACLTGSATAVRAQIPPQTQPQIQRPTNPNAMPPPGAGGFNRQRPGMPVPPAGRPSGASNQARPAGAPGQANAAGGEERTAIRPEDAIKADGGVALQFPNTPLSQILLVYEDLTGMKIIRDANAEQATVSIETTGELPKDKAILFIEKSLLLNGYSFVPAGDGMVKLLAFDAKKPQTEGAPLFEAAADLPETDQVVSFVALLKYLNPEDAVKAIDQIIPRHSYGVLTPVPNAKALIIVENSNTIRAILGLLERLDVKPGATVTKRIQLVRADAEDVKKALDEILGLEDKSSNGTSGGRSTPSIQQQQQPGGIPQPQLAALPGITSSSATAAEVPPKILAIPRTNRLLVIAMPEMAATIEGLVEELDAASELRTFISRTLNYLSVESAMGIIGDAISRSEGEDSGGGGSSVNSLGQSNSSSNNRTGTSGTGSTGSGGLFGNNNSSSGSGGLFGNSSNGFGSNNGFGGSGGGGMGGLGSGAGSGMNSSMQPLRPNNGPRSIVIGKTLIIGDPTANSLFASGPPEHLRVLNEILDELDRRPQQILISAIIGEVQLADSDAFGLQTLFRDRKNINGTTADSGVASQIGSSLIQSANILDPRTAVPLSSLAGFNGFTFFAGLRGGLDIIARAFESDGNSRVISRPTVFTLNNTPASISSGTSFPFASSSQNLGTAGGLISNVQYQDVALTLNITPLINSADELTLQIAQENSDVGTPSTDRVIGGDSYPTLSKQMLTTTVMCKNNTTVMLGGLIRENKTNTNSRIPLISRIPILNLIGKSTTNGKDRRELLIFIHPRIVEGMNDLPPTSYDGPGSSPAAQEFMDFVQDEKRQAAAAAKAASTPVKRHWLKQKIDRLFGRDVNEPQRYMESPAVVEPPRPQPER